MFSHHRGGLKTRSKKYFSVVVSTTILMSVIIFLAPTMHVYSSTSENVDDWPIYRHDLQRSGYSSSVTPDDNATKWVYTTPAAVYSSPAVANGRVIVGCSNGEIYALNAQTGQKLWTYDTFGGKNSIWSSPAIDSGRVFIGSRNDKLYCLDESTGSLIWSYSTGGDVDSSPAVKDGKVFFFSGDGKIYCLDVNDGSEVWSRVCSDSLKDNFSSPAIVDNVLYIGSSDSNIYALDATNGDIVWVLPTAHPVSSSPAVKNGRLYIGAHTQVLCVDISSGTIIWNSSVVSGQVWRVFRSSPAIANNKVYIGYGGYGTFYCLDASTGNMLWEHNTGFEIYGSPAVADGKVYIGSGTGYFYCFNETNGNVIWNKYTLERIVSSPAISQETVFVGCGGSTGEGRIYAFGKPETFAVNLIVAIAVVATVIIVAGLLIIKKRNKKRYQTTTIDEYGAEGRT